MITTTPRTNHYTCAVSVALCHSHQGVLVGNLGHPTKCSKLARFDTINLCVVPEPQTTVVHDCSMFYGHGYSQSGSAYNQCCNAYSQSGSAYKQCCNAYLQSGSAHKQCCNAYSQSGSAHKQCENGLFAEHSQNFNLFQK